MWKKGEEEKKKKFFFRAKGREKVLFIWVQLVRVHAGSYTGPGRVLNSYKNPPYFPGPKSSSCVKSNHE